MACTESKNDYSPAPSFNTMADSVSYAIGFQSGSQLNNQGFPDIDVENYLAGFTTGLTDGDSELKDVNMQQLFSRFSTYLLDKIKLENQEEAKAFLADNKTKEGVIETVSGLQYKIIEEGTGTQATAQDSVVVYYEGTLVDDTIFESNFGQNPAKFLLGDMIPGWIEGVSLMKEGATYMLYIPSELAYGESPRPGGAIQPNDAIIFKIELVEVK
ncbi:MAG: FKBP-type peptidyl-prolyl cis-trans isomerase [Balneolaceae bacterium]